MVRYLLPLWISNQNANALLETCESSRAERCSRCCHLHYCQCLYQYYCLVSGVSGVPVSRFTPFTSPCSHLRHCPTRRRHISCSRLWIGQSTGYASGRAGTNYLPLISSPSPRTGMCRQRLQPGTCFERRNSSSLLHQGRISPAICCSIRHAQPFSLQRLYCTPLRH